MPVVNKPGANGALNAKELQSAKADGYKIAVQNASLFTITPLAVSATEAVKIDDFDLITGVSQDDYMLAAPAGSGYKTIADLKKAGKNIKYGTTGVGTGAQLASALTFKAAGIPATDVPVRRRGAGDDRVARQPGRRGHVPDRRGHRERQGGQARPARGVLGRADPVPAGRADRQEQGYDVVVAQYRFLTAPKGTPEDVKAKLAEAAKKTFATDAYKKFNEANFLTPIEVGPDEIQKILDEASRQVQGADRPVRHLDLAAKK